jgi:predicted DsbA family dithiol-disulfide isomerase
MGKKKLETAISNFKATHAQDTFTILWHPFYLHAGLPDRGVPKVDYLAKRFTEEQINNMLEKQAEAGRPLGINFKGAGKLGNTRDSHRLIQLGKIKSPEVQTMLVEELFSGVFEHEQDITSHEFLLKAALKAGLDEAEVKDWLANDKGGKEVDEEAQNMDISGVPTFIIQGKYEVGGARNSEVFDKIFQKIKEEEVAK